jgi:predicted AAA+ superfamily ATPase
MDRLYSFQANLLKATDNNFSRSLFKNINWKQRMVGIRGLRGTGKTTMLLQYLKFHLKEKGLYVSADHPYFYDNSLLDLVDQFEKDGGAVMLIDEIHKYPRWSTELKNIYDGYPGLRIIFTASSALEIQKGEADLSRRVITYELAGLSFREYLEFEHELKFSTLSLDAILKNKEDFTQEMLQHLKPLPLFKKYLSNGYFPFSKKDTQAEFSIKLNQVINTVLESDLAAIEQYTASNVVSIKKLLGIISESVPFTPNISALATKMKLGRDTVNNFLLQLERGRLLNLLHQQTKGVAALQKPDKIYLENTNLSYALKNAPDVGSLRETFFLNQLKNAGHQVGLPKAGDFIIDGKWTVEIGGKTKESKQIKAVKNSFLVLDDIESSYQNRIPLWAFGFLY